MPLESGMTKIDGVPDSSAAIPGMAFFAGSGPSDKTCGDCAHRGYRRQSKNGVWREDLQEMVYRSRRVQGCAMFKRLAGHHGPVVEPDNHACKYFEPRPAK